MNIMEKQLVDNKLCLIIATYHDDNTNKDYIIYTDESKNNEDKLNVYYATYVIDNDNIKASIIDNDSDKQIIFEILDALTNN